MNKKELQTVYIECNGEGEFSLCSWNSIFENYTHKSELNKKQGVFFTKEEFNTFLEEYTKEVLKDAAENAEAIEGYDTGLVGNAASVDKESITNLLPEILEKHKI